MSTDALRELVARFETSANALAAVAAALDARVTGVALDPALRPHVEGVVDALGMSDAVATATVEEIVPLLGEIRTFGLTNTKLMFAASRGPGRTHSEAELLTAAGDVSQGFPRRLQSAIVPQLEGLAERLERPGAAFLDIGVGVAAMAVAMARQWPSLRVVGIDPWAPALELARERVRDAGLADRVELRVEAGEQLSDIAAFDLVWIAGAFVPDHALASIAERIHAALRPGAWLLFPTLRAGGDRLSESLARMRTAMFGGASATPDQIADLLRAHGYTNVRALPAPSTALATMVVGRRRDAESRS